VEDLRPRPQRPRAFVKVGQAVGDGVDALGFHEEGVRKNPDFTATAQAIPPVRSDDRGMFPLRRLGIASGQLIVTLARGNAYIPETACVRMA
jgi:hypothetical protein